MSVDVPVPVEKRDFVEVVGIAYLATYENKKRLKAVETRVNYQLKNPFDKYGEDFLISIPYRLARLAGRVDRDFRTVILREGVRKLPISGYIYLRSYLNKAERREVSYLDVLITDPFGKDLLPFSVSEEFVHGTLLDLARDFLNVTERPQSGEIA
jgi:hypothetical protein